MEISVIQILREINFTESKSYKNSLFPFSKQSLVNFSLQNSAKMHQIQTSEALNVLKGQILYFYNPQN